MQVDASLRGALTWCTMQPHLSGESFLLGLARIALTFITFASIINIFGREKHIKVHLNSGLKLIFEHGIAAMLLALLPFPILFTMSDGPESEVWRIAEGVMSFYLATVLWRYPRSYKRTKPRPPHPTLFLWTFTLPTLAILGIEAFASVFRPGIWAYSWGLFWLLVPPIIQFAILTIRASKEPEEVAGGLVGAEHPPEQAN